MKRAKIDDDGEEKVTAEGGQTAGRGLEDEIA